MKNVINFSLLSVIFILSVIYLIDAQEDDQKRGCYDDETKHYWPVGESYNPIGRCLSMDCVSEDGVFDALPCAPYVSPEGGCEVVDEDLTKPYPECCSTMKCKESDNDNINDKDNTVLDGDEIENLN